MIYKVSVSDRLILFKSKGKSVSLFATKEICDSFQSVRDQAIGYTNVFWRIAEPSSFSASWETYCVSKISRHLLVIHAIKFTIS